MKKNWKLDRNTRIKIQESRYKSQDTKLKSSVRIYIGSRRLRRSSHVLCLMSWLLVLFSCSQKQKMEHTHPSTVQEYSCTMHPQVKQNKPGTCPICHMELEPKGQTKTLKKLVQPVNEVVFANIRTVSPQEFSLPVTVKLEGYITYDTRYLHRFAPNVSGRIEKLNVKYNFQPIKKGEVLMELYSPELLTQQKDYLFLLENDRKNTQLVEGAREKLALSGMSKAEIRKLENTRKPDPIAAIASPYAGHAHAMNPTMKPKTSMGNSLQWVSENLPVKEGQYVEKGKTVFNIYSTSGVWVVLKAYGDQAKDLKIGQPVHLIIENNPDKVLDAKIDFIQPYFEEGQDLAEIRIYLPDQNHVLKIGNLIAAQIRTGEKKALWLPESAIYDLGTRKIVWIKKEDIFTPTEVKIGDTEAGKIEILSGLNKDDLVATSAGYLVDSQGNIK